MTGRTVPAFGAGGSNVERLAADLGIGSYAELHAWSVANREEFWRETIAQLGIRMRREPDRVLDLADGVERPRWLPGARLNIVETCFAAPADAAAVIHQVEGGPIRRMTYGELDRLSNRVARGLGAIGLGAGDAVAIDMPMTAEAVAAYLGVLKIGGAVVGIADSFAPDEIAMRLRIANARAIITADVVTRGARALPLYEKVVAAHAPRAVVLAGGNSIAVDLREGDLPWDEFLGAANDLEPHVADPDDVINVLFSSGTTGEPKAIPWTHTTPIKCAADGWLHQDIRPGDVVAWPTSLGWMMGPWLIFAALMNRATIALHAGVPTSREFGVFVQDARVTMLGLVPSLVKAWRTSACLDGLDWSAVRVFSSTGEASTADDMRWLMTEVADAPVIEYCGGTEIGGGYVTGSVVQPAIPATFSTPALGLDLVLLDEEGRETDEGEVFLVPPSIGLSTRLLNRDHHEVYHAGTPAGPRGESLRRHGDRLERRPDGYYRAHGRADDTMNLGGIKVSSAEIERVLDRIDGVLETAAVAVPPPEGGPERLVAFAVLEPGADRDEASLLAEGRDAIRSHLNPLFKLSELHVLEALPRTASNKVMRRVLRDRLRD